MGTSARVWEKPQLIVLGHGEPEEVVLTVCKRSSNPPELTEGPEASRYSCLMTAYSCGVACSSLATS